MAEPCAMSVICFDADVTLQGLHQAPFGEGFSPYLLFEGETSGLAVRFMNYYGSLDSLTRVHCRGLYRRADKNPVREGAEFRLTMGPPDKTVGHGIIRSKIRTCSCTPL